MATVAFISLYDRNAHGQRLMSANLKQLGHRVHMIFMKRYNTTREAPGEIEDGEYPWTGINENGEEFKYASNSVISDKELDLLHRLLVHIKPDVVGLTVNTPLRQQNARVSQYIKSVLDVPVIWGGYDPTVNPRQCLGLCDYACLGEGDDTMREVAERADRGEPLDGASNLAFLRDGKMVMNRKAPLIRNLDSLPWRDNSPDDKYFIEDDALVENYEVINDRPAGSYQAMTSRGCPYRCSYCCEASLKDAYSGEVFLRRRSPRDCVSELRAAKERFALTEIIFEDEIFGMELKWLTEFVSLYKQMVALPFTAYIYPTRSIDRLLPLLKSAGLKYCCLALESGSVRINKKVFDRVYDRDLFLKTVYLCKELDIPFYTDIITYNPYEEEDDLKATLDVLLDMGGGFDMCVNKLFVLPGTRLADKMQKEGKEIEVSGRSKLFNFYCRLYWISSFSPDARWAVRALQRCAVFRDHPEWLNVQFVKKLLCGPLARIGAWARRHNVAGARRPAGAELPVVCR